MTLGCSKKEPGEACESDDDCWDTDTCQEGLLTDGTPTHIYEAADYKWKKICVQREENRGIIELEALVEKACTSKDLDSAGDAATEVTVRVNSAVKEFANKRTFAITRDGSPTDHIIRKADVERASKALARLIECGGQG